MLAKTSAALAAAIVCATANAAGLTYDIDAKLEGRTLVARAHVDAPWTGDLRLVLPPPFPSGEPQLAIASISTQGRPVPFTALPDGSLRVAHSAGAGALDVTYRFRLNDRGRGELGYDQYAGEPNDLWFPDVRGPSGESERFRDFRVKLTLPRGASALTSGGPVAGGAPAAREARHVEGFALNIAEGFETFEVKGADGNDVTVTAFYPPALREPFRQAAQVAADAIAWYRNAYGFFPSARVGIAPGAPPPYSGGFPAANVFYIHRQNLSRDFVTEIVAHELGHYYWGRWVLSSAGDNDLDWLMLGNGIWADQLYVAGLRGRSLEEQLRVGKWSWFRRFASAQLSGKTTALGVPLALEGKLGFDYNTDVRHAKGAVGVFTQAHRLGTDAFLAFQRRLLEEFRYRPLSPAEFARRLDEAGAKGAIAFFSAYGSGGVPFDWRVAHVAGAEVLVERRGTAAYPLVVEARDASGKSERRVLAGEEPLATLRFSLTPPLQIALDPDGILPMASSGNAQVKELFEEAARPRS